MVNFLKKKNIGNGIILCQAGIRNSSCGGQIEVGHHSSSSMVPTSHLFIFKGDCMKYRFVKGIVNALGVKDVLKVGFNPNKTCNFDCV